MRRTTVWAPLLLVVVSAADAAGLEGRWTGSAAVPGRDLPIVIDLARDAAGGWTGSLIVPGFDVKGAPLDHLVVQGDEARFDAGDALGAAPFGPATFVTRLAADGRLRGELSQAGNVAALSLARTGDAQVETPRKSTPVASTTEGRWVGKFELGGYPREVTIDIANRGSAAPEVHFVVVGRASTRLPVDFVAEEDGLLRIESRAYRLAFEGRVHAGRIDGTVEVGPQEIPLQLRRPEKTS
jgi:hypothetical protein